MTKTFIQLIAFLFLGIATCNAQKKHASLAKPKPSTSSVKTILKDTLQVRIGNIVSTLSGATGWVKDDFGKWISSPHRIPYEDPDLNNEYYDRTETGKDNFKEMNLLNLSIKGKKFYVLAVRYMRSIHEEKKNGEKEWKCYPAVEYYVIPKEEIKRLSESIRTPLKDKGSVEMKFLYYGSYFCFSEGQFLFKMKQRIEWNITEDHSRDSTMESYFQFALVPKSAKAGKTLRLNYGLVYAAVGARPAEPDYTLFDEQFYEIPPAKWAAFANVSSSGGVIARKKISAR
jgi:hypothetical protein